MFRCPFQPSQTPCRYGRRVNHAKGLGWVGQTALQARLARQNGGTGRHAGSQSLWKGRCKAWAAHPGNATPSKTLSRF